MRQGAERAERAVELYRGRFGDDPEVVVRAPGRATLLGAHIDYSEGWVLPVAIEPAVHVAAGRRGDRLLELRAADLEDEARLDLDRLPPPVAERSRDEVGWADYAAGVAWALAEAGHRAVGLDALITGDLPMASGLSSSAALESALLLAWRELADLGLGRALCVRLGHWTETAYLGLQSGVMDQYVILHARRGCALFLDCRSLEHESIPLGEEMRLVIADSGVRRRLVDSGFNDRRAECQQAVELLRAELPGIATLRDVSPEALEEHVGLLPWPLERRARHVVGECQRAQRGAVALREGDLVELGRLVRRSHESSRDLYQVSLPELDLLAAAAWEVPGCLGARFSGGGFGGCVAALVQSTAVEAVGEAMAAAFEARFGRRPELLATGAAGAAGVVAGL